MDNTAATAKAMPMTINSVYHHFQSLALGLGASGAGIGDNAIKVAM